jgi:hypothetical protein
MAETVCHYVSPKFASVRRRDDHTVNIENKRCTTVISGGLVPSRRTRAEDEQDRPSYSAVCNNSHLHFR